ncbi:unnamed protein product [Rhodiola kirilowii]
MADMKVQCSPSENPLYSQIVKVNEYYEFKFEFKFKFKLNYWGSTKYECKVKFDKKTDESNHSRKFDLNVDCSTEEDGNKDIIHFGDNTCDSDDEFDIELDNDNSAPDQEIDGDFDFDNDDAEGDQMFNMVVDKKEIIPPYVGMVFGSADDVLHHCHEYGQANGFQIRIRSSERVKGTSPTNEVVIIARNRHIEDFSDCKRLRLVCSKERKSTIFTV